MKKSLGGGINREVGKVLGNVRKWITANAKITVEENELLTDIAKRENLSNNGLLRLLIESLLRGEIEVENGAIKSFPTSHEKGVCGLLNEDFDENERFKDLKIDRLVKAFEEKGYPDHVIKQQIEMMESRVREGGKFNPRRCSSDWGC